jgi:hypothetical protein
MKKDVGLWVDQNKTMIVTIVNKVIATQVIISNTKKRVRIPDGGYSKPQNRRPQGATAEDVRERQPVNQVDQYYNGIIATVGNAETIWIFGPGEAKIELENRLKHEGLGARIEGVETVDQLTDPQIAVKVRSHFENKE